MSSHKKRRELNRATAEHTNARVRAELAQGIVNFENLMEHAMGVRIKELERKVASRDAEVAKLKDDNEYLYVAAIERDQLRAHINMLREALTHSDTLLRDLPNSGGFYGLGVMENNAEALASTLEQPLAEYRNKVIEECAKRAEAYAYMSQNFNALAEELRAMKEQP